MTASRRLRALEGSLSPAQAVLCWLAEARGFGSFAEYAASTLEAPEGATPLERISERVERAVRRERRSESRATIAAAIAGALEDTLFRYELVLRLNAATIEQSERLAPLLRALVATLDEPTANAPALKPGIAEARTVCSPITPRPRAWREQLGELVATVTIEEEARTLLERDYLAGADTLFADAAGSWRTLTGEIRQLDAGTASERPQSGARTRRRGDSTRSRPTFSLARRAKARAGGIAADARLAALVMLGERWRATELLRSRVTGGADGVDPHLAVRALERTSRPLGLTRAGGARGSGADEREETIASAAHPLDGLSAAEQARQLHLIAAELEPMT
jgi:hypothetical protein